MCMYMSVCMYVHVWKFLQSLEECGRSLGAVITGCCEAQNVGDGNRAQVFYKSVCTLSCYSVLIAHKRWVLKRREV